MALFRMDRAYAWTPEMMSVDGSVTVALSSAQTAAAVTLSTVNVQMLPALLNNVSGIGLPNPGTSNLLSNETVAPLGARGLVFLNPNSTVAAPATNQNALPRGVAATTTGTLGSEMMLDLSAYDADIISASATMYAQNTRGVQTRQCYVSAVDNINKLVYIQCVTIAGNTATTFVAGDVVNFDIALKDTFSV